MHPVNDMATTAIDATMADHMVSKCRPVCVQELVPFLLPVLVIVFFVGIPAVCG